MTNIQHPKNNAMSEKSERSLAERLEKFVKEQASLYGEVISYVPATRDPQEKNAEPTAAAPINLLAEQGDEEVATRKHKPSEEETIEIEHHGFKELKEKLEPYKDEGWTSARSLRVFEDLIQDCHKCRLGDSRTKLVFGVGDPHANVLVIGEAPGADEDATGEPFVGRAGQLLNKMLAAIKFERNEVYIANILKSRPPNNRDPKPDEVEACEPYLWKQILMIKPKMILCMGRVAGTTLMKMKSETLSKMRGQVYDFYGIKVMVTYHPAALLRNPDWKHGAWEDLKKFRRVYDQEVG